MRKIFPRLLAIVMLIFLAGEISAQVHVIDKEVKRIESLLEKKSLAEKVFPNMSYCGGSLKGYYENDRLVYINAVTRGEIGYKELKYYLLADTLIKMLQVDILYELPGGLEEYCKAHRDKAGNCDLAGLRSTIKTTVVHFTHLPIVSGYANKKVSDLTAIEKKQITEKSSECFHILVKELSTIQ